MAVPFSVMDAPETNPFPIAVRVKSPLPAATAEGEIDVSANEPPGPPPPVIVRLSVPEVVLSAFNTRMLTVPELAICAALTLAVSWDEDVTVVGRDIPFHRSVVPWLKLDPDAVSEKSALPAATVSGEMEDRVGARTPLKPPQPHQKTERTKSRRKTREERRAMGNI